MNRKRFADRALTSSADRTRPARRRAGSRRNKYLRNVPVFGSDLREAFRTAEVLCDRC